jgi:hypothetical protein
MFSHEAAVDIWCDAPDYPMVHACRRLGFARPLDVPWYNLHRHSSPPRRGLFRSLIRLFFGHCAAEMPRCRCGARMPPLDLCAFMYAAGHEDRYRLGQCQRCHAIYWKEA